MPTGEAIVVWKSVKVSKKSGRKFGSVLLRSGVCSSFFTVFKSDVYKELEVGAQYEFEVDFSNNRGIISAAKLTVGPIAHPEDAGWEAVTADAEPATEAAFGE